MSLIRNQSGKVLFFVVLSFLWQSQLHAEDAPPLPSGLEEAPSDTGGPALPEGLVSDANPEGPLLPEGLGGEDTKTGPLAANTEEGASRFPFALNGFFETRFGVRTQNDPYEKEVSIAETRLQLQFEQALKQTILKLTSDFLYDPVLNEADIRLEEGLGFIDLREASLLLRPLTFVDLKIGRQILTWGTGDLIFINDLFPKDWNAFFIGRDTEYLKAPSDALKVSFFSDKVNLDLIYTPRFDPDRFIDGRRISFFNTALGRRSGRDAVLKTAQRDLWLKEDEIALRLYQNVRSLELALYAYKGYSKSPGGFNPILNQALFPRLSVYGGSARGPLGKGIAHLEVGFYDSEEDRKGKDPFIRNSEFRFLLGYEQEALQDLTLALQYYLERILDYDNFRRSLPAGSALADENRHVMTFRLTQLLMNQNLRLSLFTFYSPSDQDVYFRPKIHYKINDAWSGEMGGNIFIGEKADTFFGQFEKNNNVYVGMRFSF